MSFLNNRNGLVIVTDPVTVFSHRIRLIVEEKALEAEMISISLSETLPADFLQINPTGKIPVLFDRDLMLYDERVIAEYLDERYPHPALMPIDPNVRAKLRMLTFRIESDWYARMALLEGDNLSVAKKKVVAKELAESISLLSPLFRQGEFLLNETLSLLDCAVLPILWRLPYYDVVLPEQAANNIKAYQKRLMAREGFEKSLSYFESAMTQK